MQGRQLQKQHIASVTARRIDGPVVFMYFDWEICCWCYGQCYSAAIDPCTVPTIDLHNSHAKPIPQRSPLREFGTVCVLREVNSPRTRGGSHLFQKEAALFGFYLCLYLRPYLHLCSCINLNRNQAVRRTRGGYAGALTFKSASA